VRRTPAFVLLTAAVTLTVGATTAFVTLDKSVTVAVDGHVRTVSGLARTVGDVLDSAGLEVGPHDSVTPGRSAGVREGSRITLRHGRPLMLDLDDRGSLLWTVEETVGTALDSMRLRTDGAFLSAPRSSPVPLDGMALVVRRPHRLSVVADGRLRPVVTTAATVRAALLGAGVTLATTDRVSVPLTAYPEQGMVVAVTRVRQAREQTSSPLPFPTVRRADSSLYRGRTVVATPGRLGARVSVFDATYVDGRRTSRRLVRVQVTASPQPRIVRVGTRPLPKPRPAPRWTGRGSGLNWAALARCESGGNPHAISSTGSYRGLYQFSFGTWRGVGGSGDPAAASSAEQTYRAQLLYSRAGRAPWPVCGRYL